MKALEPDTVNASLATRHVNFWKSWEKEKRNQEETLPTINRSSEANFQTRWQHLMCLLILLVCCWFWTLTLLTQIAQVYCCLSSQRETEILRTQNHHLLSKSLVSMAPVGHPWTQVCSWEIKHTSVLLNLFPNPECRGMFTYFVILTTPFTLSFLPAKIKK